MYTTFSKHIFVLCTVLICIVCRCEGIPESKEISPEIDNLRSVIEQQAVLIERLQNKVDALENRVSMSQRQSGYASKKVAFSARFYRDDENNGIPLTSRQILKFDDVVTNIGGGYSSQTGIFTAPVTGVYAFFLNFMTTVKRRDVLLAIDQQGTTLDLVYAQGTADPHDQGSALVTTYMTAGQQLWVRQHVGDAIRGSWYTIFSGFLIDLD